MAAVEFTLEDVDPNGIEAGGMITVPGWYQVVVEDAYTDRKNGDSEVIECVVTAGPFKGAKKSVWLKHVDAADDPVKAKNRFSAMGSRLGLVDEAKLAELKAAGQPASIDFAEAIGKECWLEMTKRKDQHGEDKVDASYIPLYPLDHERVPAEMRRSIGIEVAEKPPSETKRGGGGGGRKAAKTPPPATNGDFSDL